jgi:hypothetical protein
MMINGDFGADVRAFLRALFRLAEPPPPPPPPAVFTATVRWGQPEPKEKR